MCQRMMSSENVSDANFQHAISLHWKSTLLQPDSSVPIEKEHLSLPNFLLLPRAAISMLPSPEDKHVEVTKNKYFCRATIK